MLDGMTMTNFICVGLDIRTIGAAQTFSADATVWEQELELYDRAKEEYGINENSLQLLHPKDTAQMANLRQLVRSTERAALISFEFPLKVLEAYQHCDLIAPQISLELSDCQWRNLGFDVCDINGFFSYLDMTNKSRRPDILFSEDRLTESLLVAQAANLKIPAHAPFVVVRLKMCRDT